MIAGGASGIVGMARDLGGDDRLVAFMQYLRVLIVVLATPLLVTVFGGGEGIGAVPDEDPLATPRDWLITAAVAPVAALAARSARVPAGTLLGPMVVAGALTLAGVSFVVPPGRPRARVRADRPAGRAALHARHRPPARPPAVPGAGRARRASWSAASGSP